MGLSYDEVDEALSPASLEAVRRLPGFRRTVERIAAGGLAHTEAQDEETRWLTKDLGRIALYISALILHATLGKVSVYDLMLAAALNETCSRARVMAFVSYARASGRIDVAPGEGHWTKRPLHLRPSFIEYGRTRLWREMESAALILPEAAAALAYRDDERAFPAALVIAGQALTLRRDVFRADEARLQPFIARHAGLQVLHDLLCRQKPERGELLDVASLSRKDLSRRHRVSRVHLNRLLFDAEKQGVLSIMAPDQVRFSPVFSRGIEHHFALVLQVDRLHARAILQACGGVTRANAAVV